MNKIYARLRVNRLIIYLISRIVVGHFNVGCTSPFYRVYSNVFSLQVAENY